MTISDNYNKILNTVIETALKCGRNPDQIKIISVSKTFEAPLIQEAIDSGIKLFGENKIQEANEKFHRLSGDFKFHMIGHLQSNKVRDAVNLFDLIHSIDKVSTASKLNDEAEKKNKIQRILLQLKTTDEVTKYGVSPDDIIPVAEAVSSMKNLQLEGIMSIGPNTSNEIQIQKSFIETAKMFDKLNNLLKLNLKELSMGMSGDYTIAIKEGATMVRIGSAIFGNRVYK